MENKIISAFKNNKLLLNIDTNKLNFNDVRGKLVALKEGQLVFKKGDSSDYLYLIINGMVRVIENDDSLVKNSIFLSEGDFFGHADLYESSVRKTTAIASASSYVIAVSKAELNFLLWQDPNILINLKKYCGFPTIQEPTDNTLIEQIEEQNAIESTSEPKFNEINNNIEDISDNFNLQVEDLEVDLNNINIENEKSDIAFEISDKYEQKLEENFDYNNEDTIAIEDTVLQPEIELLEEENIGLSDDYNDLPEFIDDEEPENIEIKFSDDLSLGSFRTTTFYDDNSITKEASEEKNDKENENTFNLQNFNIELNETNKTEQFEVSETNLTDDNLFNLESKEDLSKFNIFNETTKDDFELDEFKQLNEVEELKTEELNLSEDEHDFSFEIPISNEINKLNEENTFSDNLLINDDLKIEFNEPKSELDFNFSLIESEEVKKDENIQESSSLVEEYLKQFESNNLSTIDESEKPSFSIEEDEIIKSEGEFTESDNFDKNEFLKNEFEEFNLEQNFEDETNANEFNLSTKIDDKKIDEVFAGDSGSKDSTLITGDEELRKQGVMNIEQLQMILKAAQLVSSKIKLDDVLQNIVSVATNVTKSDRGTLYLVDKEKGEIWSKVVMGNELKEIRLKIGDGIAGWVAQTGEIVNIKDVQNDSRFKASFDKSSGYITKTMICFPIKNAEGEIIGVHQLLNSQNGEFTQLDETFLNAISIHAAIALENAELVEKLLQFERISSLGKMANFLIQDIKNPILISKKYAEHLKTKHLQPELDKIVNMILEQLSQVADMVLTTSNYSEKNKVLRQINTNLISVLNDYNSRLEQIVKKKNCSIVAQFNIDALVRVDLKEFYQAYQHIIKNAADSMPNGGEIKITTLKEPGFVKILISDSGIGIPDSVKEKIFDPFMSYGKKEGTGLGLAIAKKIVNEHSGTITFESIVDQGSTFVIKLPIAQDF
ncbi:MAG TPA: ATP-binding protein [Melioribacteraceae bacterium]|nr:ATP-binding protein [Melioribacteraceae bacterium]